MLTKEERAAIAERTRPFNGNSLCYSDIYRCLFGVEVPGDTSFEEDSKAMVTRIIDLCDTSNMIELPVDKDGKVIHIGDVVYTSDGEEHKMAGYIMRKNTTEIILSVNSEGAYITTSTNNLTHKKPVTIASLVKELKDVIGNEDDMSLFAVKKLSRIADQLERLGDSDD